MCDQQSGVVSVGCPILPRPVHHIRVAAMLKVTGFTQHLIEGKDNTCRHESEVNCRFVLKSHASKLYAAGTVALYAPAASCQDEDRVPIGPVNSQHTFSKSLCCQSKLGIQHRIWHALVPWSL